MKKNNGVSLIALVTTIALILILVGVVISAVTGNGLFNSAKNARDDYRQAQIEDSNPDFLTGLEGTREYEEIRKLTHFQEQYFESEIIR